MAQIKKNQLANIIFPMVDKTDFATIETGITASNFNSAGTKKFYGVTHGNSTAFTSGTISKATTLVRSGIFQQTLKASEDNYDYLLVRFTHPSCADQLLVFQPVDYDDSDIFSFLSDIGSDIRSYLVGMSGMLSDVYSNVSDFYSDFQSRVPKRVATDSQLSDLHSDLKSFLAGLSGLVSDIDSALTSQFNYLSNAISDAHSDLRSQISGITVTVTASDMSDIASRVWATAEGTRVDSRILVIQSLVSDVDSQLLLNASMISDVQSALDSQFVWTSAFLSDMHSDLRSQISGITATISVSDISDIASAVWANTIGARVDSRILLIQSNVSDVESQLDLNASMISDVQSALDSQFVWTSAFLSDMNSDLSSQIGGITATISVSDISDIASAVWANTIGARVDSRILLIQSNVSDIESQLDVSASVVSDIYSLLSDHHSDFQSRVAGTLATSNQLSQVQSDLRSYLVGLSGMISDVDSQLTETHSLISDVDSQLNLAASIVSDIYSLVSDVDSQLTETHSLISDIDSQLVHNASDLDSLLALLDDPRGEPGQAAPPVNPDLATKIDFLYKAWRNKKDNDGTMTKLYADDGTTVDQKQTTGETGGTVTKGKWTTGP